MVTQEAYLFSGTVADNIALGKPDATPRRDRRRGAGRWARTTSSTALPDGYDTDVNKRGGGVSAGQRQLISFARAFLADPAVLILDEATASLDIPSERLVQEALQTLLADRTAIIIAHRLSTVAIADRVLVMEHGRIIEDGTPRDLIGGDRPLREAARRLARLAGLTLNPVVKEILSRLALLARGIALRGQFLLETGLSTGALAEGEAWPSGTVASGAEVDAEGARARPEQRGALALVVRERLGVVAERRMPARRGSPATTARRCRSTPSPARPRGRRASRSRRRCPRRT